MLKNSLEILLYSRSKSEIQKIYLGNVSTKVGYNTVPVSKLIAIALVFLHNPGHESPDAELQLGSEEDSDKGFPSRLSKETI